MIDQQRSKLASLRVAVNAEQCRFGSECLLCGESNAAPTTIEFKRVIMLGVINGGQTFTLDIPLCEHHAAEYLHKKQLTNTLMTASFILGMAAMFGPAMAQESGRPIRHMDNGILGVLGPYLAAAGCTLIVLSFVLLLSKNRNFPIKVQFSDMFGDRGKRLMFKFPNQEIMNRFLRANEGDAPAAVASTLRSARK